MFISTISLGNKNVNWINGSGTLLSSAGTPALVSSSLIKEVYTFVIVVHTTKETGSCTVGVGRSYTKLCAILATVGKPEPRQGVVNKTGRLQVL